MGRGREKVRGWVGEIEVSNLQIGIENKCNVNYAQTR